MSPDYSSICAQCPQKPCTRTSSLIETRPILIKFFNGIPNTCPARASKHFDQNDWKALGQALDEQTLRRILSEVTPVAALVYMTDRDRRSAAVHAVASGRVPILYTPPGSAAQSHVQNLMQVKCKSTVRAIQKIIEAEEQEQALGAAEQVPKPAFLSAKWILPNSQEQGSSEQEITTTAAALENVVCKVDTEGLSYGDQILFHVYLKGMDGSADTKLDTLASSLGSKTSRDSAVIRFLIPDQKTGYTIGAGRELYFIARNTSNKLELKSPRLRLQETVMEEVALRFDLAIDPEHAEVRGDVFLLRGLDTDYSQSRTVADDRKPQDGRLTLLFSGVSNGKKYALSQVHEGEEVILYPEITPQGTSSKSASRASIAPAPTSRSTPTPMPKESHIAACKVVFRECHILGETQDLWKQNETTYPLQIGFVKEKWVYVFASATGGPTKLIGEYYGNPHGLFQSVNLGEQGGKDKRPVGATTVKWMTLPFKIGQQKLDLFACLSQIQIPWKRIEAMAQNPKARCYHLGDTVGGICWMPGGLTREFASLKHTKDDRIENPGEDVLVFGLIDYIDEARRRAKGYQERVKDYLQLRFDHPRPGESTSQADARRRKKYIAGIIKTILSTQPDKVEQHKLKNTLADHGKELDGYLEAENTREVNLKCKAEGAGAALVKWLDHPAGGFEETLKDYTFTLNQNALWEKAETEVAFLIQHFEVTSLTRLYGRKIYQDKANWIHRYFLNAEGFKTTRKTTQATLEILSWLSRVLVESKSFHIEQLEQICGVFFPGIGFEWAKHSSDSWKEKRLDFFHKETNTVNVRPERKTFYHSIEASGMRQDLRILQVTKNEKPLEEMGHLTEAKLTKVFLGGMEAVNLGLALNELLQKPNMKSAVDFAGSGSDVLNFVLEIAKFGEKKIGRGLLSSLGTISGLSDTISATIEAREEADEGDYDAVAAKATVVVGSAVVTVGNAMVAYTVYTTMADGVLWAGEGLSLTGAGAPVGAGLVLAGITLQVAGSVVYLFANDSPVGEWIRHSPFGTERQWDFTNQPEARIRISTLHALLYPYTVAAYHPYLTANSGYGFLLKGVFNPHTKVTVHSFALIDKQGRAVQIFRDLLLEEAPGTPYHLSVEPGNPTNLFMKVKDTLCWELHAKQYPGSERGFVAYEVDLEIDVNGDGEVIWPADNLNTKRRLPFP